MNATSVRPSWKSVAVSLVGNGHVRREIPCQDASAAIVTPRPALIVCDGRGSAAARLSQEGSRAAVHAFCAQVNILEPYISSFLDRPDLSEEDWRDLCRIFYRTLVQAKLDCAAERHLDEREFDFTAAFAIAGTYHMGFFQVGDGALVVRRGGMCETVFKPEKGEFANCTEFVRSGGDADGLFLSHILPVEGVDGLAATSDGPQHLMFRLSDMMPGKVFDVLFNRLHADELSRNDVLDYLARPQWAKDIRGDDDRSLIVMCPPPEASAEPEKSPDEPEKPAVVPQCASDESPKKEMHVEFAHD